jgi:dipeptidyl aminopeptidase/acylaminoacyl peptidase
MGSAKAVARLVACALILLASVSSLGQTPVGHPPVEAFGTLPGVSAPALSPDGKHLATIQVYNGRPVALIHTLDPLGVPPVAIPYEDGFIVSVRWANNDRLLVVVNVNQKFYGDSVKPWFRTISINTTGTNAVVMFANMDRARNDNYSTAEITDIDTDDPDHVYMPLYTPISYVSYRNSIFRVDVTTGDAERYVAGSSSTVDWVMDGHGHVVARIDQTHDPLTDHLMLPGKDDDWKEVAHVDASGGNGLDVAGLNEDGSGLAIAVYNKAGMSGYVLSPLDGGADRDLYFDPKFDVDSALLDPWTGRVLGVSVISDRATDVYFDPKLEAMQRGLQVAFGDYEVHAESWDLSQTKVIVEVEGPRMPSRYYLLDRSTHQASLLSHTYQSLQESDLGVMSAYPYKARDGLDIPAYLTLPPGKAPKNLPVVILPHGGPMARDAMSFDWEAQFLANRGYAVLQPNFRGSSGYGKAFEESGYGQWGLKMQDDITDGVQKLIADGIADPKRICIVGGSYGGYAALAGAAFTPDLYACAAGWAGVYDLRKFLSTRAEDFGHDSAMISSWSHYVGDRWDDSEKLDAASPSEHADKIKCPVLLMHGVDDATVRIDQSEEMERALRRAGKKVTFIKVPHETHYMQASSTRILYLSELEKFLSANIGN